jgi:hypothetical protein
MTHPARSGDGWSIDVRRNPWPDTIPNEAFYALLERVIAARAADVSSRHTAGEYVRDSMGFCLLDPTVPDSTPTEDSVLALFAIGDEGNDYVVNAIAKVFEHRDHGADCGALVYSQSHRLADGDFRFGFSVVVEGTPVGASGLTELQDRYQATLLGAEFNLRVAEARETWGKDVAGAWYHDGSKPGRRYATLAASARLSGGSS